MFFSRVYFVCWLVFVVRSTPVLPQLHAKDPGHSAKSADGRLHLNTHAPLTQRSRSGLTMLSRQRGKSHHHFGLTTTALPSLSWQTSFLDLLPLLSSLDFVVVVLITIPNRDYFHWKAISLSRRILFLRLRLHSQCLIFTVMIHSNTCSGA